MHYGSTAATVRCVEAAMGSDVPVDVFVVAVGPLDAALPHGCAVVRADNRGYAASQNLGITRALERDYRYVWLLNNDVVMARGLASTLISALEADARLGAIAPVQATPAGPLPSAFTLTTTRADPYVKTPVLPSDGVSLVDVLVGPATMVRVEAARKAGRMDERYFHYFEDDDYALALRGAGYLLAASAATILHDHGAALAPTSPRAAYYMTRNRILLLRKWFPRRLPINRSAVRNALALRTRLQGGATNQNAQLRAMWHGMIGVGGPARP